MAHEYSLDPLSPFKSGRLREVRQQLAARSVDLRGATAPIVFVITAELDLHEGRLDAAREAAERVLAEARDPSSQALAHRILGEVAANQFGLQTGRDHFQQAREVARASKLQEVAADVELSYWACFGDALPLHAAVASFSRLRSVVSASALPHHLAELHLLAASLEARRNCAEEAVRHQQVADALLASSQNSRLQTELHIGRCSIALKLGDLNTAANEATAAIRAAEKSGYLRSLVRAQTNEVQVLLALGALASARSKAVDAFTKAAGMPHVAMIALECLAQVENAHGNPERAQLISNRIDRLRSGTERVTGDDFLTTLNNGESSPVVAGSIQFIDAETGSRHTDTAMTLKIFTNGSEVRPDAIARSLKVDADAAKQSGDHRRGADLEARSHRIAQAIGLVSKHGSISPERESGRNPGEPELEDGVLLLELGAYPHVLGSETYSVLKASESVDAVALIARGKSCRCILASGWSEEDVLRIASDPGHRLQMKCGSYRDETWEVIAESKDSTEHCRITNAVARLVSTAVTLDRYRREEKQRSALWPASTLETDGGLWASPQMTELLSIAKRIAPSAINVLLTGETGTGKEVLARAIHRASGRTSAPFVPFNCAAVPRDMLDSQLFGYRKGAFTGANEAFDGVIRAAAGGTLFLDEIGEIGLDLQPKLLRFLETHEVHGLGEPHPVKVDVRVVAASNADLEAMVRDGRFREDLFYRLNGVRLHLPPLRERREEIPALVEHYLRVAADEQKKGRLSLDDETLEYLVLYSWPGNVRQIVNETNRMAALADPESSIAPSLLSPEIQASRRSLRVRPGDEPEIRIRLDQPLNEAIEAIERVMVVRALDRAHGNFENAARLLGISRKGLFLKRRRWGMQRTTAAAS